jgi:hypothetical protein
LAIKRANSAAGPDSMLSHSLITDFILFYFILFLATKFSKKEKILSPFSPFNIKILAKLQQKMGFFFFVGEGGESVATFMSNGYTFMRSLEKSRQLNRNLHGNARHSGDIREFTPPKRKRKKNTVTWMYKTSWSVI